MRHIWYRWDEIADGIDASSRLNVHWQRTFIETSLDGISISSLPAGREILVFEGDSDVIGKIRELVDGARGELGV